MEEWKEFKLGDVCKISSSKRIFANEYQNTGIPFYRGKEIIEKHNGTNISNELFISEEKYNEIKNKFGAPKEGDLLLSSVGTLGVPYIVRDETFYFKDGNLTWFYDYEGINNFFLYYWFLSPKARFYIDTKAIGSTQKALTIETLKKFEILLPTIQTQNKIVSILKSLDDKIEVNRRINENLEAQAQALFKSWFVDFEPFKNGEFVESELGMIPKGWRVEELENICTIKYGKGLGKNDLTQKGFPVFGGNGIIGFYTQYLYELPQILVSCRGAASGKIIESLPQSYVTSNSLVLELKDRFYYNYLKFLLLSSPLYDYATGSAQPQITIDNIKGVKILLPLQEAIQKMNPTLENIGNIQRTNEQESRRLSELRDTLLPKLMSGELKVFGKPDDQS
ncbi:MAG: restriction endonuclease subunit S [Bacteroidaceae bacterium]|nr:restriction endonuclease subunit S [Bacteroidaceae bacterium]